MGLGEPGWDLPEPARAGPGPQPGPLRLRPQRRPARAAGGRGRLPRRPRRARCCSPAAARARSSPCSRPTLEPGRRGAGARPGLPGLPGPGPRWPGPSRCPTPWARTSAWTPTPSGRPWTAPPAPRSPWSTTPATPPAPAPPPEALAEVAEACAAPGRAAALRRGLPGAVPGRAGAVPAGRHRRPAWCWAR